MKEFDWIESNEHEDIGMIAQQLKEVLPDLVYEDKETSKLSIKTDILIPYLIKAIQELSQFYKKFDLLPNKLNLLGNKLNTLNVFDNIEASLLIYVLSVGAKIFQLDMAKIQQFLFQQKI